MYKTDYFVRFVLSRKQAQRDLRRGYSFSSYEFFASKKEAKEYWEENNVPNPTIAHCDRGWGLKLDGLCGFGPFESIEESENFAREKKGYAGIKWPAVAVYSGRYAGQGEGEEDLFHPEKLVKFLDF